MVRLLLILIPLLTFVVPQRFFSLYATIMAAFGIYVVFMFTVLTDASREAFAEFGIELTLAYILLNFLLLGIRYALIRRARARIIKLPAPKE